MILIFLADIVLDDCITADSLFSCGSDARLIILRASVHNYVGAIRETVDADSTQADIVALNFRSTAFGDLDTRTYNVGDLKSEYKLASTFTLNEYTAHRTVLNLTILDNDFIVRLRTREDSPSTKVYKWTIGDVNICLHSNHCWVMICLIAGAGAAIHIE